MSRMPASQVRDLQIPFREGKPSLLPLCELLKGKTSNYTGIELGMTHSPKWSVQPEKASTKCSV